MGNLLTSCTGGRRKNIEVNGRPTSGEDRDGGKGGNQPDSAKTSVPLVRSNSKDTSELGSRLSFRSTRGSLRRLNRQESQVDQRNKPTDGLSVEDAYETVPPGKSRGRCVIFAMNDFGNAMKQLYALKPSSAIAKDASDLRDNMEKLEYDVDVISNPSGSVVKTYLRNIANNSALADCDSFVCFVLSQCASGTSEPFDSSVVFYDRCLPRRKLFNFFQKEIQKENGGLSGIPKIFILQTMSNGSVTSEPSLGGTFTRAAGFEWVPPTDPDVLVVESSSPKLFYQDDPRLGTFFVQKLVSLFRYSMVNRSLDLRSLLVLLSSTLHASDTKESTDSLGPHGITVCSTLRKDFFLNAR